MAADPGSMLKISIKKCDHSAEKNIFVSVANRLSMLNIFNYYHGHIDYSVHDVSNTTEAKKVGSNETYAFKIQTSLTVGGPHFKVWNKENDRPSYTCALHADKTHTSSSTSFWKFLSLICFFVHRMCVN